MAPPLPFELCSVVVTDDNLYASVVAAPGTVLALSDVKRSLAQAGIEGVYDDEQLEMLLEAAEPGEPILVAAGTPPEIGVDARLEYLFQTKHAVVATDGSNDKLDWKAIRDRSFVKAGATLVRKHAATKGRDGRDLFGRTIVARNGDDARLACGENVAFGPDGRSLVARKTGIAKLGDSGAVSVADALCVNAVDLASGSLCTLGAVLVDGNVTEGFTVEAAGDVYVRGNVEGATILAGGRVVVAGGVRQGGKIDAVGSVAVRFVDPEGTVKTLGELDVVASAVGARLFALGPVIIGDEITGGSCESATFVQARRAGTAASVLTTLVVGPGPTQNEVALARSELANLERRLGRAPTTFDEDLEQGVASLRAPRVPSDPNAVPRAPSLPPPPGAPRRSDGPQRAGLPSRPGAQAGVPVGGALSNRPSAPSGSDRVAHEAPSLAHGQVKRPASIPARPSALLAARPPGALASRPPLPGAPRVPPGGMSSTRIAATAQRPSQHVLARPSTTSLRAAPVIRPSDPPVASAKKEFQLQLQVVATERQLRFFSERSADTEGPPPFVLVEESAHPGVVVRIHGEQLVLDARYDARRFQLDDGRVSPLPKDAPFAPPRAR